MEIISHRGYWKLPDEKNSETAFHRSFSLGYGTETDIRDYKEELRISHDIANDNCMSLERFFQLYNSYSANTLALNVKSDGLQQKVKALLEHYKPKSYFVFDMSIPDTLGYLKEGLAFFSRQSEYEEVPAFYDQCAGIWLDAFVSIWYGSDLIRAHADNGKKVAIVSSELHKRDHKELWGMLKDEEVHLMPDVILCTDIPEAADQFFFKTI